MADIQCSAVNAQRFFISCCKVLKQPPFEMKWNSVGQFCSLISIDSTSWFISFSATNHGYQRPCPGSPSKEDRTVFLRDEYLSRNSYFYICSHGFCSQKSFYKKNWVQFWPVTYIFKLWKYGTGFSLVKQISLENLVYRNQTISVFDADFLKFNTPHGSHIHEWWSYNLHSKKCFVHEAVTPFETLLPLTQALICIMLGHSRKTTNWWNERAWGIELSCKDIEKYLYP